MSKSWWYVEGTERKGPVDEAELKEFLDSGTLNPDSFIWRKPFENWVKFNEVEELTHLLLKESSEETDEASSDLSFENSTTPEKSDFDLSSIRDNERVFYIKTGTDRNTSNGGAEYGPFSLDQLTRLFEENRINNKTYIFTTGMATWDLLADSDLFNKVSGGQNATIEDDDRREYTRKPFVANMYFHDQEKLYEGVCRDISIGGMQVLVSDFPGEINDEVTMNVHPDNSEFSFVASGKIVRILDGNSGFSLRFDSIAEDTKSAISNYLESN